MMVTPKIGVYICHCGVNIAATVDVRAVAAYAAGLPGVAVARDYTYMCSEPGQGLIQKDIAELGLNRVVVASCSPRMHEPTFQATIADAGLNPYCLDMANIREQCSWVHPNDSHTTLKAMQLVSAAVARASRLQPLQIRHAPVEASGLVIGGGVAGLQAALDIAGAGYRATIIEREPGLGGQFARLYRTFPTLEPAGELVAELIQRVTAHPRIEVLTGAELVDMGGYIGNFEASVRQGEQVRHVTAGVIIVATGYEPFDPARKPELGYRTYPQVITTFDFERFGPDVLCPGGREPHNVVFIQCVGSRDPSIGAPHCSRVCCMVTARQARLVRERLPKSQVTVFYMDVRAFGKGFEEFVDQARLEGVLYRRGNPSEIVKAGEKVLVRAEDTLLGELVEIEADLVVLAVGMAPRSDAGELGSLLKLSRSGDGFFMEAHPKLRPVETAMAGVYLAGCCQGPKDMADSIVQARAAAAAALIPLKMGRVQVEAATSFVNEELCSGCGQCSKACSYGALSLHPTRGVMKVNAVLCQGCGACSTACPSGAINVNHFTFEQVMAQVDALAASLDFESAGELAKAGQPVGAD
jgi:heterodisulfide reductase subunit A2